jgi:hypothetical protein
VLQIILQAKSEAAHVAKSNRLSSAQHDYQEILKMDTDTAMDMDLNMENFQ